MSTKEETIYSKYQILVNAIDDTVTKGKILLNAKSRKRGNL